MFELTRSGGDWTKTILYTFSGQDGALPNMPLTIDGSGNLYSTTRYTSGSGITYYGYGRVYELAHSGSDWIHTTLYTFTDPSIGYDPSGVVFANSGNLVGTTGGGGTHDAGTVFQLVPGVGLWTFNPVLSFSGSRYCGPPAPLTADSSGNLYGVTQCEGFGSVFKLTPIGGGWIYTVLHSFQNGADGADPWAGVVLDANGNIYGTTHVGGNTDACQVRGCGVVWEITP